MRQGSRVSLQQSAVVDGILLANVQTSPRDAINPTSWSRRAGTCQEGFLSNRLLIFTTHQLFWNCNSDLFWEDVHREQRLNRVYKTWGSYAEGENGFEVKRSPYSTRFEDVELFQCYAKLVEDYTSRRLTYQQDALDAFGGVVAWLRDRLETEFFYGLPIRFLEQSPLFDTSCFLPDCRR